MGPPLRFSGHPAQPPPPVFSPGGPTHVPAPASAQNPPRVNPSPYSPARPPPFSSAQNPYDADHGSGSFQASWQAPDAGSQALRAPLPPQSQQAYSPPPPATTMQAEPGAWYGPPSTPGSFDPSRDPSIGPDRRHNHRRDIGPYSRAKSNKQGKQGASHLDREDPRTAEEKPCRTLFVRNVDNSVDPAMIQAHFAQFGDIRTFFEIVVKRGICFITYFDVRGAELAKQQCHAMEFNGRKVDVHYSLPKDQDTSKRCDGDQNQGTLFILLKRHPRALTDADFRNIYSPFGDIRSIRRYKDQKNARFLEYYDSRACTAAHDALGGKDWTDSVGAGQWDIKYAWDASMVGKSVPKGSGAGGSAETRRTPTHGVGPPVMPDQPVAAQWAAQTYSPGPAPAAPQHPNGGYISGPPPLQGPPPPQTPPTPSTTSHFQHNYATNQGAPPLPLLAQPSQQQTHPYERFSPHHGSAPPITSPWGPPPQASSAFGPPVPSSPAPHPPLGVSTPDPRRSMSIPSTVQGPPTTSPYGGGQPGGSGQTGPRLEQAQKVQHLLASLSADSNSTTGVTDQQQQSLAAASQQITSDGPLPANIASLLAGVQESLSNNASHAPATLASSPVPRDPRNSTLAGSHSTAAVSAQKAQNSIAAMLDMLQKQQQR
ncbi:unnamed protein product [Parajaminaea phylloscopi]